MRIHWQDLKILLRLQTTNKENISNITFSNSCNSNNSLMLLKNVYITAFPSAVTRELNVE